MRLKKANDHKLHFNQKKNFQSATKMFRTSCKRFFWHFHTPMTSRRTRIHTHMCIENVYAYNMNVHNGFIFNLYCIKKCMNKMNGLIIDFKQNFNEKSSSEKNAYDFDDARDISCLKYTILQQREGQKKN